MSPTSLILLAALSAQPTRTTPTEILTTCYFNDASVDAMLLNHAVEISGRVAAVDRDGIGGYIVKLEEQLQTAELTARSSVHCYFDARAQGALARITPGVPATIRGVIRKIDDDARRYVDANVLVTVKQCEIVGAPDGGPGR
jgi:hypothetical protein